MHDFAATKEKGLPEQAPARKRKYYGQGGIGGDDGLDSLRHLAMAYKEVESVIPKSYFVSERMTQVKEDHVANFGAELTDPTRLAMIAATQAAKYDRQHPHGAKAFSLPRASSSRHRNCHKHQWLSEVWTFTEPPVLLVIYQRCNARDR